MQVIKQIAYRVLFSLQRLEFYRLTVGKFIRRQVRCRVATVADAAALSQFYGPEAFRKGEDPVKTYSRQIRDMKDWGCFLIATAGKKVVGAAVIRRFSEDAKLCPDFWIFNMLVHIRYRRLGIGEDLIRLAMQKAAKRGAKKLYLWVFEDNRPAVNLYHKTGFQRDSIPGFNERFEEEARQGERRRVIMSIMPDS